ncbi:MAG: hypothetical protein GVY11_07455 [Gammaproteobacteria bacterium]|jgi:adenosine deaminase|nr:hypothetical protein [Gammaproteobacteria bacterium]
MDGIVALLAENVVPVAATAITALVGWAVVRLETFIRRTETTVDDEVFDAFLDGVAEGAKRPDGATRNADVAEARKDEG